MGMGTRSACLAALDRSWGPTLTLDQKGLWVDARKDFLLQPGPGDPASELAASTHTFRPCPPPYPAHAHLHQKFIAWDPLHGLDHEVGQCLLLLVLTHALLKSKAWQVCSHVRKDMQKKGMSRE